MAKLNALTRLCIVLYVLGITLTPLVGWFIVANQQFEWQQKSFEICRDVAGANFEASQKCMDDFLAREGLEFWPLAWEIFQGAVLVGAILWLIFFGITRTIRWILAGRNK